MGIPAGVADDNVICVFEKGCQLFREKIESMKGEKERGKNRTLKSITGVWDRARYIAMYPDVLATTREVIVDPFNQPIWGICGSNLVK